MTPAQFLKIRLNAGLSPGQLSDIIGVDERSIRRYEDGTRKIRGPVIKLMYLVKIGILPL